MVEWEGYQRTLYKGEISYTIGDKEAMLLKNSNTLKKTENKDQLH